MYFDYLENLLKFFQQKAQLLREQLFIVCLSLSLKQLIKALPLSLCNRILCDQDISICALYLLARVFIDMCVKFPQIPGVCVLFQLSSTPGDPERC